MLQSFSCLTIVPIRIFIDTQILRKKKWFFQCLVIICFILNRFQLYVRLLPRHTSYQFVLEIRFDHYIFISDMMMMSHIWEKRNEDKPCIIVNGIQDIAWIVVIHWTCIRLFGLGWFEKITSTYTIWSTIRQLIMIIQCIMKMFTCIFYECMLYIRMNDELH